jgi:hypothetical protein
MIPVDGHKNLFRDENSGAIINVNSYEYNQYLKLKRQKDNERSEIESLKKDVEEIKKMLLDIFNKI